MERQVLYNTHGSLLLVTGFVVALLYWMVQTDKRDRSSLWIAGTTFSGGAGLLLLSVPHSSFIGGVGCCLFLATAPLLHIAVGSATRESVRATLPILLLFSLGGFVLYLITGKATAALVTVPAAEVATIWLVLRNLDTVTRWANIAMAAFLALHMVTFALRINIILAKRVYTGYLAYGGMLTTVGLGVSFVAMEALRSRREFELMAMTDPLTGLLNRRALELLAPREVSRCIRRNDPCSALMLDIDRFKEINDGLGHAAGDTTLRAVAGLLQSLLRPNDVVTRHGGDEFFVVLPGCSEEQTLHIVDRLQEAITECDLRSSSGDRIEVSVSIGVVTMRGTHLTLQDLLHGSDLRLYHQKEANRLNTARQREDGVSGSGGAQVQPSSA